MIYSFSLQAVALAVGALWIVLHLPAALAPDRAAAFLVRFPRSRPLGVLLMGLVTIWGLWLGATVDLGDFTPMRPAILWVTLILGVFMTAYSQEFLAVRGLAALLLLGANVLLDACFLRDEPSKLVLVSFAYVWIVAGLALLFSPYLMRDLAGTLQKNPRRLRLAAWAGAAFGAVLLLLGWLAY
ncbi:MAG: hypothetical protein PW734_03990 [Verrucomicrobium sp.]|nr:hypothetical protein [Verrucomicrobium sp.]